MTQARERDDRAPRDHPMPDTTVQASPMVAGSGAAPVVHVLHEIAAGQPVHQPRSGRLGWVARATLAGLLDAGAVQAQLTEHSILDAVRAPAGTARVVAVLAGKGGVGASTTAIALARVLAAMRDDRVVLVDAHAAAGQSLSQRVLGHPGPTLTSADAGWSSRRPVARHGLAVVDASDWSSPADGKQIREGVLRLADSHAFAVLDIGNDASPAGQAALAVADRTLVVTSTDPVAVGAVAATLERAVGLRPAGAIGAEPTVVVVETRTGRLGATLRLLRRERSAPPLVIPYDSGLSGGLTGGLGQLAQATRAAYLGLAALVASG